MLIAAAACLPGQTPSIPTIAQTKLKYTRPNEVPSAVRPIVAALGTRLQLPGKERIVASGSLRRKTGTSTVRIVNELPGQVRIDETGGRGRSLSFDLVNLKANAAVDDDDLARGETGADVFHIEGRETQKVKFRYHRKKE